MGYVGTPVRQERRTDYTPTLTCLYLPTYLPTCSLTSLPAGLLTFGESERKQNKTRGEYIWDTYQREGEDNDEDK